MFSGRRRFLRLGAGAAALAGFARLPRAQGWPSKIVRLVVGFPPGGGADAASRIIAAKLSELLGQQVVVENRPGAGGNVALDAVVHAPPDGYTMLMSPSSLPIQHLLFASLPFDTQSGFAPVSLLGTYPNLLVVSKSSRLKTLKDYVEEARANPGKVTYATPGIGSVPYLAAELFKIKAGVQLTHVPYKGVAAGAMNDLVMNRIDSMFNTTGSLLQSVRAGQTMALGASTPSRSRLAPDIPTFSELGVACAATGWYAIFVPAATPADVVARMGEGIARALAGPVVRERYATLGVDASGSTPGQLAAMAKAEVELWAPIIKANGIKGE